MDEASWDGDLARLVEVPSLLQSWSWGEVQAHAGWRIERVSLPGGGRASVQLRGQRLGWGYVPRGPVPATDSVLRELAEWASRRGLVRLRVEPDAPGEFGDVLRAAGFEPRPDAKPQQPAHTRLISLGQDEEEVLASFKPKTRYNIRLAQKKGVEVAVTNDAAELARQSHATESRQRIRLPGQPYYKLLLDLLPWCRVYVAHHQGEPLAAILVARHSGRAYYLFGGSNGHKRELMPMYAAQWAAIQEAARDGLRDYDLWGVPPPDEPAHAWRGLQQFKTGFGGRLVEYCGVWDRELRPAQAAWIERLDRAKGTVRALRNVLSTSAN